MEDMRKKLFFEKKNGYERIGREDQLHLEEYAGEYMCFLNECRTEREAVETAIEMAEQAGFVAYNPGMPLKEGLKIYRNNRGKSLLLAVIGRKGLEHGAVIAGAHVDCPRMASKNTSGWLSRLSCMASFL